MFHRQTAPELLVEWIIMMQVIIGLGHFEKALRADKVFSFHKAIETPPAIAGIKKGDEILENSVGG
jgi:hypothetical protein